MDRLSSTESLVSLIERFCVLQDKAIAEKWYGVQRKELWSVESALINRLFELDDPIVQHDGWIFQCRDGGIDRFPIPRHAADIDKEKP